MSKKYTFPDIGLDSAREHLFESLRPAYGRFTEAETRENMREVAQAAWAMYDRLWHDMGTPEPKKQFTNDLFNDCPELRWMRDIAEANKHAGLHREDVEVVRITGAENPGGTSATSGFGMMMGGGKPICTLAIETRDGRSHPVPKTLKTVVEFWVRTLASAGSQ